MGMYKRILFRISVLLLILAFAAGISGCSHSGEEDKSNVEATQDLEHSDPEEEQQEKVKGRIVHRSSFVVYRLQNGLADASPRTQMALPRLLTQTDNDASGYPKRIAGSPRANPYVPGLRPCLKR